MWNLISASVVQISYFPFSVGKLLMWTNQSGSLSLNICGKQAKVFIRRQRRHLNAKNSMIIWYFEDCVNLSVFTYLLMGDQSPVLLFLLISGISKITFKKSLLFFFFFKEITSARNKEEH